jgi:ATP-binding cassette subfamily F protein uup
VEFHPGDYDYYLEKRAQAASASKVVETKPVEVPAKQRARKLSYKEQRELEGMEAILLDAEGEVETLTATLADPEFFTTRAREYPEVQAKLEAAKADVAALYARWQELEALRG